MRYTNLEILINNLTTFAERNTNKKIVLDDNPMKLLIGFKDEISDETWEIKLSDIKDSTEASKKILASLDARQEFVNKLNENFNI